MRWRGGWNALSSTCLPVAGLRLGFDGAACSFMAQTAFGGGIRSSGAHSTETLTPVVPREVSASSLFSEMSLLSLWAHLCMLSILLPLYIWLVFVSVLTRSPCLVCLSGAIKVTACGRTLTSWSRMATGDPGQSSAPAHGPVELEFAFEHASATIQCRSSG